MNQGWVSRQPAAVPGGTRRTLASRDLVYHVLLVDEVAGALDQVITTSNITPMITGAAGVPTWVMLRKSPFWYWGLAGYEAPFFASVRCYRQDEAGVWDGVLERVAEDFRQNLTSRGR